MTSWYKRIRGDVAVVESYTEQSAGGETLRIAEVVGVGVLRQNRHAVENRALLRCRRTLPLDVASQRRIEVIDRRPRTQGRRDDTECTGARAARANLRTASACTARAGRGRSGSSGGGSTDRAARGSLHHAGIHTT